MRAPRIDPDVERVMAFFHARGQAEARGQLRIAVLEPEVGAFGLHQVRDAMRQLRRQDGLALGIVEDRQRHTPGALPRDAPIRAGFHGAMDPVAAPGGQPFDAVDLFHRLAAQCLQRDKELFDGAENDRRLGTPAMRIGMADGFLT